MFKKVLTFIMFIFVIIGLGIGLYFAFSPNNVSYEQENRDEAIFGSLKSKQIQVTDFFT